MWQWFSFFCITFSATFNHLHSYFHTYYYGCIPTSLDRTVLVVWWRDTLHCDTGSRTFATRATTTGCWAKRCHWPVGIGGDCCSLEPDNSACVVPCFVVPHYLPRYWWFHVGGSNAVGWATFGLALPSTVGFSFLWTWTCCPLNCINSVCLVHNLYPTLQDGPYLVGSCGLICCLLVCLVVTFDPCSGGPCPLTYNILAIGGSCCVTAAEPLPLWYDCTLGVVHFAITEPLGAFVVPRKDGLTTFQPPVGRFTVVWWLPCNPDLWRTYQTPARAYDGCCVTNGTTSRYPTTAIGRWAFAVPIYRCWLRR